MPKRYPWIDENARGVYRYRVHLSPTESVGLDTYAQCQRELKTRGLVLPIEGDDDAPPTALARNHPAVSAAGPVAGDAAAGAGRHGPALAGRPVSGAGLLAVELHPHMTLEQAAAWCHTHGCELHLVARPGAKEGDCPRWIAHRASPAGEPLPWPLREQAL